MLEINQALPAALQQRFDELVARRRAESLTPDELRELIQLTDEIEQCDAKRLAALVELARVRGETLAELMDRLGIQPRPYA